MYRRRHDIHRFMARAGHPALVEVKAVAGSTPREAGTWMLVGENAIFRTIGGGYLENMAIEKARDLIITHCFDPLELHVPLGPDIGQCCGGMATLEIRLLDDEACQLCVARIEKEMAEQPEVLIFGAGHVGIALAEALSLMPLRPVLIDTRKEELARAPDGVETCLTPLPERELRHIKPGSAVVILTHDHGLDFLIAQEALLRCDAAYIGMIGSKTKRARFKNWMRREIGDETETDHLVCPIGGAAFKDKRPEVIAALVSAEIIACLHSWSSENQGYGSGTETSEYNDERTGLAIAVRGNAL